MLAATIRLRRYTPECVMCDERYVSDPPSLPPSLRAHSLTQVDIVGEWGSWVVLHALTRSSDNSNTWSVTINIPPGTHQFKFLVDGTWMLAADYAMAASHINGFPVQNNAVVVAGPADASAEAGSRGVWLPQDATWCSPDKKSLLDLVTGRDPAAAAAAATAEAEQARLQDAAVAEKEKLLVEIQHLHNRLVAQDEAIESQERQLQRLTAEKMRESEKLREAEEQQRLTAQRSEEAQQLAQERRLVKR